jgi:excisionase family DNA binding protein
VIRKAYSLREAARLCGIDKNTLHRLLEEAGFRVPRVPRGSRVRVPLAVLQQAIALREVALAGATISLIKSAASAAGVKLVG